MNKQEQIIFKFREVFDKLNWLNKREMGVALKGYTPSEIHALEYISLQSEVNVTKLANNFYMTRSAMTKITKKLIQKGLIKSYQNSINKKEIYFRLTSKGKEVNNLHDHLHAKFRKRDSEVFDSLSEVQFKEILEFVNFYNIHLDKEMGKAISKK